MIPPRYTYKGDEEKARSLRGFAQSQLEILGRAMTFQGLKQDKRIVTFSDGTVIKAEIDHGLGTATVYCPPAAAEAEEIGVKEITAIVNSTGGILRQGASIGDLSAIPCCNEQGAAAPVELCEGAILPFNLPIIVGNNHPFPGEKHEYQVRGGIHPYTWLVTGDDYFFKDEEDNHIYETGGHVQAPLCHGGKWHGYYGGAEGITGMLFMLMGGRPINKDMCERDGGTLYLYRGTVEVYTGAACGGKLVVTDACGEEAEMVLEGPSTPVQWDYDNSDEEIDPSESGVPIAVTGGSGLYTWEVSPDDTFSLGAVMTTVPTNTLNAEAGACGTCTITVTDCGVEAVGHIRCTAGQWIHKAEYDDQCVLGGAGTFLGSGGSVGCLNSSATCSAGYYYELISGNKKQYQMTCLSASGCQPHATACDGCADRDYCGSGMENCIDPEHEFPCQLGDCCLYCEEEYYYLDFTCFCSGGLRYYEWEC